MDKFKTFYSEKKGKYILFFGFYIIFFIFLGFYMRGLNTNKPNNEIDNPQEITTYDISNLINNDYSYSIEINDNDEVINFNGTKNNIDYANYENKYFLDIYNINQLLKRSRLTNTENLILTYELKNSELNDILLTNKDEGVNNAFVYLNEDGKIERIDFDLANYLEKDKYQITIDYIVGESNENSSS